MSKHEILFPAEAMRIAQLQSGTCDVVEPACGSRMTNMRSRSGGTLESVAMENICCTLPRDVGVICDERDGALQLLTVDSSLQLVHVGSIDENGEAELKDAAIATLDAPVCASAGAGEFLVLSGAEGQLSYLLWHPDERRYSFLGHAPGAPRFKVQSIDELSLRSTVESVSFGKTVDLRAGLNTITGRKVCRNVEDACKGITKSAHDSGRWCQPVVVRVVTRLWNGGLLNVSEPQVVAAAGYQFGSAVGIPVVSDGSMASGTAETFIEARGFKIAIELESLPETWSDVVRGYEVWVAECGLPVLTCGEGAIGYRSTPSPTLMVTIETLSSAELTRNLLMKESFLVGNIRPGTSATFARGFAGAGSSIIARNDFGGPELRAKVVCGHGGFLYLGDVSAVCAAPYAAFAPGDGQLDVKCSVTLYGGETIVASEWTTTGDGKALAPLLSYPDRDATELRITVRSADGSVHGGIFSLAPSPSGENMAVAFSPDLTPLSLEDGLDAALSGGGDAVIKHRCVLTSVRGCPPVVGWEEPDVGGDVRFMIAQQIGGGAFTRQYLYCFTRSGVSALMHDVEGRPTNCRMISEADIAPGNAVATDAGVFAASERGDVFVVSDARVRKLTRNMPGLHSAFWHEACGEVVFMSDGTGSALAFSTLRLGEVSIRDIEGRVVCAFARPLLVRNGEDSQQVIVPENPSLLTMPACAEWQSAWMECDCAGLSELSLACVAAEGSIVKCALEMLTCDGCTVELLCMTISHEEGVHHVRQVILPHGVYGHGCLLRLRIEGKISVFAGGKLRQHKL